MKVVRLILMKESTFFVYILLCNDNTLYIGYTTNLNNRLSQHNNKKGAKYTRGRTPVILVFWESFATKSEALKKEFALKQLSRAKKLELIKEQLPPSTFASLFEKK